MGDGLGQQRLEDAGILTAERRGKQVYYEVRYAVLVQSLRDLADAIEACCVEDGSADQLVQIEPQIRFADDCACNSTFIYSNIQRFTYLTVLLEATHAGPAVLVYRRGPIR